MNELTEVETQEIINQVEVIDGVDGAIKVFERILTERVSEAKKGAVEEYRRSKFKVPCPYCQHKYRGKSKVYEKHLSKCYLNPDRVCTYMYRNAENKMVTCTNGMVGFWGEDVCDDVTRFGFHDMECPNCTEAKRRLKELEQSQDKISEEESEN